ncbi:hypothetical protein NMY22_g4271 [Coprinellus aureogranulatus]|nr:hypothetical protein NMY22_g4271 [Coprinellus aureogranulatus]
MSRGPPVPMFYVALLLPEMAPVDDSQNDSPTTQAYRLEPICSFERDVDPISQRCEPKLSRVPIPFMPSALILCRLPSDRVADGLPCPTHHWKPRYLSSTAPESGLRCAYNNEDDGLPTPLTTPSTVRIGDVGVIQPGVKFHKFFNICEPSEFQPLKCLIRPVDVSTFLAFEPHSFVTLNHGTRPRTAAIRGTILALPAGGLCTKLREISKFRDFSSNNVDSWARFMHDGIATFKGNKDPNLNMLLSRADPEKGKRYVWQAPPSMKTTLLGKLRFSRPLITRAVMVFTIAPRASMQEDDWLSTGFRSAPPPHSRSSDEAKPVQRAFASNEVLINEGVQGQGSARLQFTVILVADNVVDEVKIVASLKKDRAPSRPKTRRRNGRSRERLVDVIARYRQTQDLNEVILFYRSLLFSQLSNKPDERYGPCNFLPSDKLSPSCHTSHPIIIPPPSHIPLFPPLNNCPSIPPPHNILPNLCLSGRHKLLVRLRGGYMRNHTRSSTKTALFLVDSIISQRALLPAPRKYPHYLLEAQFSRVIYRCKCALTFLDRPVHAKDTAIRRTMNKELGGHNVTIAIAFFI